MTSRPGWRRNRGQAMTEVLICATAVLIPLFLIVPTFAKFIDMKQTAIQAARYEAWEYTVWYSDAACERSATSLGGFTGADIECPMGGFDAHGNLPGKNALETQRESRVRFFGPRTGAPFTLADKNGTPIDNPSWFDHSGAIMYQNDIDIGDGRLISSSAQPGFLAPVDAAIRLTLGIIDLAAALLRTVLGAVGSDFGFDAINTDGFAKSTVQVTVDSPTTLRLLQAKDGSPLLRRDGAGIAPLTFTGKAGVLTDGWNAGGRSHTYNQAAGIIPTSAFSVAQDLVFTTIPGLLPAPLALGWNLVLELMPELRPCGVESALVTPVAPFENSDGSLWFGYIDSEAVHRDRLTDPTDPDAESGSHTCDNGGRCDFDDTFTRDKALPANRLVDPSDPDSGCIP